jgi:hypothetical protein
MGSNSSVSSSRRSPHIQTSAPEVPSLEAPVEAPVQTPNLGATGSSVAAHPGSLNRQAGRQAAMRQQLQAEGLGSGSPVRPANAHRRCNADMMEDCLQPWVANLPQAGALIADWRVISSLTHVKPLFDSFVVLMGGLQSLGGCSPESELAILNPVQRLLADLVTDPAKCLVFLNACAKLPCRDLDEVKGIAHGEYLITLHQAIMDVGCFVALNEVAHQMEQHRKPGVVPAPADNPDATTTPLMRSVRLLMVQGVRQFALARMDESARLAFEELPPAEGLIRKAGDMRWEVRVLAQKSTDETYKFALPSQHIPLGSPLSLSKTKSFLRNENSAENLERVLDAGLVLDPEAVCHYLSEWPPLRVVLDRPGFRDAIGLAAPQEHTIQNTVALLVQRSGLSHKLSEDLSLGLECKRLRDEARHPDAPDSSLAIPQASRKSFALHRKNMFQPRLAEAEIAYWLEGAREYHLHRSQITNILHQRLALSPEQDKDLATFLCDLRHTQVQPEGVRYLLHGMRDCPRIKELVFSVLEVGADEQAARGGAADLDDVGRAQNWWHAAVLFEELVNLLPLGRKYRDPLALSHFALEPAH